MEQKRARIAARLSRRNADDQHVRILTDLEGYPSVSYQNESKSEEDLSDFSYTRGGTPEIQFVDLGPVNDPVQRNSEEDELPSRTANQRVHSIFEPTGDWSIADISKNLLGLGVVDRTILEASWKGDIDVLDETLKNLKPEQVKGKINCRDSRGRTPLHLAAGSGHSQIVQLLVQKGAEVNVWDKQKRATPLSCASACNSLPVLEILLANRADVNAGIKDSKTALHWAVQSGSIACVKKLLECGALQNSFKKDLGTPLHVASKLSDVPIVELLLKHGADVKLCEGGTLRSALHFAADEGSIPCMKLLLEAGASTEVKDSRGQTPLHLASNNSDSEVTGFLLDNGANPNVTDKDGRTPLHRVVSVNGPRDLELECNECLLLLLEQKAEINWQDSFGYTALHLAAVNDAPLCASLLLRYGSDVTLRTKAGVSALSLLVRRMPHVIRYIRETLDKAISVRSCDANDPDCELKFDFRAIISNNANNKSEESLRDHSVKSKSDGDMQRETEFINCLITTGHKAYLSHPLIEAFIILKWSRVRAFFWASIIFHAMMVLLFTTYVITVYVYNCPYGGKLGVNTIRVPSARNGRKVSLPTACNQTDANNLSPVYCELEGPWRYMVIITWSLLVIITIMISIKEVFQMLLAIREYIKNAEHWAQWLLLITVWLTVWPIPLTGHCVEYWHYPSAAVGIFLAWSLMLVRIGRFPALGSYVQMLGKVIRNFGQFILAYSSLLLAFAFSFCVLFPEEPPFASILSAPLKVLTMMVGELNYDELFYKDEATKDHPVKPLLYPITSQIIFGCFVLVVTIVLMNLLVGLAVSDIQSLKKGARLNRLSRQMASISQLESFLFSRGLNLVLPKTIGRFLRRRALLVPSSYKWTFYFRPNDPRDTRLPKKLQYDALRLTESRRLGKTVLPRRQTTRIRDSDSGEEFRKLKQKLDEHKQEFESILEEINNKLNTIQSDIQK